MFGFDDSGQTTITGLINVNANNIYTEELLIDTSTTSINVGKALEAITVDITQYYHIGCRFSQGQVATAIINISTLQGQVSTLQGQVSTLQGQVSTLDGAQRNINTCTLQSEMSIYRQADWDIYMYLLIE